MNSVVKFLVKLQGDATTMVAEARKVTGQLDAIQRKAKSVGNSLRSAFSLRGFGDALMSVPGMQFLTNPYTMIGAGIGAITKLGAEAEMTATTFEVLVGSQEKAKNMLDEITALADKSPFGKLDLTDSVKQMMGLNVTAEDAMTYMRQLGDISAGSKDKLQSLSLVMGQVYSAGKLNGTDLMQFINAGFNPLLELTKIYPKKTYEQLKEAMGKGLITKEHVAMAIEHATSEGGQFYNMTERTAKTVAGRWSSAVENVSKMAVALFDEIQPYILKVLGFAERIAPYLIKGALAVFRVIKGGISFIKEWWREIALAGSIIAIVTIGLYAKSVALAIYGGAVSFASLAVFKMTAIMRLLNITMLANPVGAVIVGIALLTAAIVYCWHKFAGFRAFVMVAWDTLKQLGTVIKDYVVSRINELLEGIGNVGKALKALLSGDFEGAWSTMGQAINQLTGKESRAQAGQALSEVIGGVQGNWQKTYAQEQAKDAKGKGKESSSLLSGITPPSLKGSAPIAEIDFEAGGDGKKGKKGKGAKTADAIATGGSRSSTINISIAKLIESQHISMMDKANPEELERMVVQALNRSIALATSSE